ncbi:hypothetical protein ACFQZE_07035 [Paenibacillus sp. GCM10027627]|uniref:hypothetical protein n=1 Tax=unclassified Paenibacillus TaxID=185978 RepID=UPI003645BA3C
MFGLLHEKRMEIIQTKEAEFLANVLCYISGFMGDDISFQMAFEDAMENTVYCKDNKK